jgi:hypothetical protein
MPMFTEDTLPWRREWKTRVLSEPNDCLEPADSSQNRLKMTKRRRKDEGELSGLWSVAELETSDQGCTVVSQLTKICFMGGTQGEKLSFYKEFCFYPVSCAPPRHALDPPLIVVHGDQSGRRPERAPLRCARLSPLVSRTTHHDHHIERPATRESSTAARSSRVHATSSGT